MVGQSAQMVGLGGLEPPTLRLSGVRSNHLSYRPILTFSDGDRKEVGCNELPCVPVFGRAREPDLVFSLKKEVIQPQVPLRLPCYDLVPITELAFGAALLSVRQATSGALGFHDLTGGVYKAQEHIHRGIADPRLLAIPTSCRRVSACNPNWG
jgi:hypothetical protein